MSAPLKWLLQSIVDLLYPPHCEFCKQPIAKGFLCKNCINRIRWIHFPCCYVCSLPVSGRISKAFVCTNCRLRKFHFQFAVCGCETEEVVRKLIHRFKYRGVVRLEAILSQLLFHAWRDARIAANPPTWLVPVPLHPLRERERGFNQAKLLAEGLSRHTRIGCRSFLKRSYPTSSQTLLPRSQRRRNLRGVFTPYLDESLHGAHVMLVDDVLTTGSTLEECSIALLTGGARTVSAITVARA